MAGATWGARRQAWGPALGPAPHLAARSRLGRKYYRFNGLRFGFGEGFAVGTVAEVSELLERGAGPTLEGVDASLEVVEAGGVEGGVHSLEVVDRELGFDQAHAAEERLVADYAVDEVALARGNGTRGGTSLGPG